MTCPYFNGRNTNETLKAEVILCDEEKIIGNIFKIEYIYEKICTGLFTYCPRYCCLQQQEEGKI